MLTRILDIPLRSSSCAISAIHLGRISNPGFFWLGRSIVQSKPWRPRFSHLSKVKLQNIQHVHFGSEPTIWWFPFFAPIVFRPISFLVPRFLPDLHLRHQIGKVSEDRFFNLPAKENTLAPIWWWKRCSEMKHSWDPGLHVLRSAKTKWSNALFLDSWLFL